MKILSHVGELDLYESVRCLCEYGQHHREYGLYQHVYGQQYLHPLYCLEIHIMGILQQMLSLSVSYLHSEQIHPL